MVTSLHRKAARWQMSKNISVLATEIRWPKMANFRVFWLLQLAFRVEFTRHFDFLQLFVQRFLHIRNLKLYFIRFANTVRPLSIDVRMSS